MPLRGAPLLAFVGVLLACSLSAPVAPTLIARTSTPVPTSTPRIMPTATIPAGLTSQRPTDPSLIVHLEAVQNDRLLDMVSSLLNMQTRHVLSAKDSPTTGIGAARDWLMRQFTAIAEANPTRSIEVWSQPFQYQWRTFSIMAENAVMVLPGTAVDAGVYIIGAHYDSISTDPFNGQMVAPGAVDNASGVAALLEIAHIMAAIEHRATLIFVAFSAEETGRQGSIAFIEQYLQAQATPIDVRGMINLDMIGSERGPGNQRDARSLRLFSAPPNDSNSRRLARQLALAASTYVNTMNLVLQPAEERNNRWGDHQSFSAAGYAAVRFIQGLEDPTRQHSPRDNIDHLTLDYLTRATRTVLAGVLVMAEGLPAPARVVIQNDASGQRAMQWSPVKEAAGYVVALRKTESLYYDQVLIITGTNAIAWTFLSGFDRAAVAPISEGGRIGILSEEVVLSNR
jgi:hypothetical protein